MAKKSYETYNTLGEQIDKASSGSAYDPNKDYSSDLKKQIASGADYDTVYNTLASRINKANSEGLSQYAWDSTTRDAIDYLLTFHETPRTYIDASKAAEETVKYNDDVANGVPTESLAGRVAGLEKPIEELRAQQNAAANPNKGGATTTQQFVAPSAPNQTTSVSSPDDYITQMYSAQKEAALAALKSAYEKNVASIDATGEKIPGVYQAARNRTAADAAKAQHNFNQQAAASGLSSGTSSQAALANSVALQGNLNAINQAEADALAELELQRTNAAIEYENAIAQAEANGNYELAAALYQEKIRVDELLAKQEKQVQSKVTTTPSYKPTLTAAQVLDALNNGIINETTLAAYQYYFGQPYQKKSDELLNAVTSTPAFDRMLAGGTFYGFDTNNLGTNNDAGHTGVVEDTTSNPIVYSPSDFSSVRSRVNSAAAKGSKFDVMNLLSHAADEGLTNPQWNIIANEIAEKYGMVIPLVDE
jgi:hypothetical protein